MREPRTGWIVTAHYIDKPRTLSKWFQFQSEIDAWLNGELAGHDIAVTIQSATRFMPGEKRSHIDVGRYQHRS